MIEEALQMPYLGSGDIIYMCSGQGSQKVGMGADLLDVPEVAAVVECASDVLGRDMASIMCAEGDDAQAALDETRNAQAAIAALSIGIGRALAAREVLPSALLGFSLGQVSALALSGMLSDEDAFALIDVRSRVMDEAAREHPGAMSALLKADAASVQELCDACAQDEVLVAANYNCPGQIVISGDASAIERAELAWKDAGKRASRLATQGAFHSPLMASACEPFAAYLETVPFAEPEVPIICNTDAAILDAASVRERLVAHLISSVRFDESVRKLADKGAHTFVEVGYGGVLSGLIRRIDKELERHCVQDRETFDACVAAHCS